MVLVDCGRVADYGVGIVDGKDLRWELNIRS